MSVHDHLEFRHLIYVTAVAETGSFTGAAQAVHVAQSAISQQIGQIEGIRPSWHAECWCQKQSESP